MPYSLSPHSTIIKLQKKAIRFLTFSGWNEHSKPLFDQLRINTVTQQVFFLNISLVHKVFK